MSKLFGKIFVISTALLGVCQAAAAEQDIGKVVAVRGRATIERGSSRIDAKVRSGIQASDVIRTAADSRAKLLFIDDSVLTLSDNSRLVVKEFIYKKGDRGKSIYNLLDGKMRSVVGKTRFEVETPTAVAAARGTVIFFEVGSVNNQAYSKIICLEGHTVVRSSSPTVAGAVTLSPGTMVVVRTGQPLPPPVPAPPAELQKARTATAGGGQSTGGSNNQSQGQGEQSAQSGQSQGQSGTSGDSASSGSTGGSGGAGTGGNQPPGPGPVQPQPDIIKPPVVPVAPPPPPPPLPTKVNITITIPSMPTPTGTTGTTSTTTTLTGSPGGTPPQ